MERLIFIEILCVHMGLDLSLLYLFSAVVVLLMAVEIYLYKIYVTKSFGIDDTY